jgi:hypothetical protein
VLTDCETPSQATRNHHSKTLCVSNTFPTPASNCSKVNHEKPPNHSTAGLEMAHKTSAKLD